MNIIDSHSHYEPKIKNTEKIINDMIKNGISKVALMSKVTKEPLFIKSHFLMGLQRDLLQYGITRSALRFLDKSFHKKKGEWNPWYRRIIKKSKKFEILQIPDNKSVFEEVNKFESKFYGWLFLNPAKQDCRQEFETFKKNKNLVGIKLHPFWHRYNINKIIPIIQFARLNKLPILLHLGYENPIELINIIRKNNDVNFILSHCALKVYSPGWGKLSSHSIVNNIPAKSLPGALDIGTGEIA